MINNKQKAPWQTHILIVFLNPDNWFLIITHFGLYPEFLYITTNLNSGRQTLYLSEKVYHGTFILIRRNSDEILISHVTPPSFLFVSLLIWSHCIIWITCSRKNYWLGGSGLNFTDSLQMSSLMCSSVHVGCSKSKLNCPGPTGSSLMSWSDERYGWLSASSTGGNNEILQKIYKQIRKLKIHPWNIIHEAYL